jgi:CheY-specific phosphatase CheX
MDMSRSSSSNVARIFAHVTQDLLQKTTKKKFHVSATILEIPNIKLSGDIASFVTFYGDYNGLLVFNFEGPAALEVVTGLLLGMGLTDADLPKSFSSDEVRNNIGEFTNQVIGAIRSTIQHKYDIAAKANIPAVVPIKLPLGITVETKGQNDMECVRVVFTTISNNRFSMELAIEPTIWRNISDGKEVSF